MRRRLPGLSTGLAALFAGQRRTAIARIFKSLSALDGADELVLSEMDFRDKSNFTPRQQNLCEQGGSGSSPRL